MTKRNYYYSDALEMNTEVVSCTPTDEGHFRVVLAETLFHPQGGGQPSDRGNIGEANVLQMMQDADQLLHITDRAVAIGAINIHVDADLRHLHTRYHSAGHLIAYAGEQFGWKGYKGNHRPGEGRIVFQAAGETTEVSAEQIAQGAAALVADDLVREQIERDGKRLVTWGDLAFVACGGTHAQRTSDIGEIVITRVKEKKGELSVQYELRG